MNSMKSGLPTSFSISFSKNLARAQAAAAISKAKHFTNVGTTLVPLQSRQVTGIPFGGKARGNHS